MPQPHRVAVAYFQSRAEADEAWILLVNQGVDAAAMRMEPAGPHGASAYQLTLMLPTESERRLLDILLTGPAIRLDINDARDWLDGG